MSFQYDIFISYGHLDDENPDDVKGWVDLLVERLPGQIQGDLGFMPRIWRDERSLRGNDLLTAAIKEGKPTLAVSNFDYSGMLTETVLLGNIAIRLAGQKLAWDGPNLKFTGNDRATAMVTKKYRKGWELMAGNGSATSSR